MKARLVGGILAIALIAGGSGAVVLAAGGGMQPQGHSAARSQYCPPKSPGAGKPKDPPPGNACGQPDAGAVSPEHASGGEGGGSGPTGGDGGAPGGTLGVSRSGSDPGASSRATTAARGGSGDDGLVSGLPVTGLDVLGILAAAMVLLSAGYLVRRRTDPGPG